MRRSILMLVVLFILTTSAVILAEDSGEQILQKMDQMMKSSSKVLEEEMILVTADGQERVRKVRVMNNYQGGEEKMLLRFLEPSNVAGTGFMMINDDMWLYLPALGKVRRIAGHARKGNFMGSDLSYEDMEAIGSKGFSKDYRVQSVASEEVAERTAYRLELVPAEADVSYNRLIIWVDAEMYLPLIIEYYDSAEKLVKTLKTSEYRQIDGRWTAMQVQVKDEVKGTQTILKVTSVDFDVEFSADTFTTRNLERGK